MSPVEEVVPFLESNSPVTPLLPQHTVLLAPDNRFVGIGDGSLKFLTAAYLL